MPWVVFDRSTRKITMVAGNKDKAERATRDWEEYCWQNGNPKRGDTIK